MPWGKFESRITVGASCNLDVTEIGGGGGPFTVALTAGDYYLTALCTHIAAVLTANGSLAGTYSCSVSDDTDSSTGRVTISATGITSFTLAWSTTTAIVVRTGLGFTGTLTPSAASHTATPASPHIWLPTCGRSDGVMGDGDDGFPMKTASVAVAPSGVTRSWVGASTRYENSIAFDCLKGYRVLTSQEVVANESLQTFWTNSIGLGKPFRWHKDRSVDATYNLWTAMQSGVETFRPERLIANHYGPNALFRWSCPVYKYTGA